MLLENLGLGDKVNAKGYGVGEVVKVTEKPSVTVVFSQGGANRRVTFDTELAKKFNLREV